MKAHVQCSVQVVDLDQRGFTEVSLADLARRSPWSWKPLLENVDAQVELSMTLIQLRALWPKPQRKRLRGRGVAARPVRVEGGRWQRVIEQTSFEL